MLPCILLDYEVELTIVIGKTAKDVSEAEALDYVLGYTVANDVRPSLSTSLSFYIYSLANASIRSMTINRSPSVSIR